MSKPVEDQEESLQNGIQNKSTEATRIKASSELTILKSTSKRNAFSELMSPKPSKAVKPSLETTNTSVTLGASTPLKPSSEMSKTSRFYSRHSDRPSGDPRSGLLAYILNPGSFPSSTVVRTTEHTVLIRDLYPKATVHLLLLPRSPAYYNLHPHDAFTDDAFLELMKGEAASAADLAASELSRILSPHSATDRTRHEAMDQSDPSSSLPPGRNYLRDLHIGVHAHPSMSHLHIHIISVDMHSESLKHRKHYNSFQTDFFIPLADYPLAEDDQRRSVTYQNANLKRDFVCWRCGAAFGNQFKALKAHLEQEFGKWRAE